MLNLLVIGRFFNHLVKEESAGCFTNWLLIVFQSSC